MAARLAAGLCRISRGLGPCARFSSALAFPSPLSVLEELISTEAAVERKTKLLALKFALQGAAEARKAAEEAREATEEAREAAIALERVKREAAEAAAQAAAEAKKEAVQLARGQVEAVEKALNLLMESKTAMQLELLRAKGLNDTRGLFEHLQHKILERYAQTRGLEGSADTWKMVLRLNPELKACLSRHLGTHCDHAAHLAATYEVLSQHVHSGNVLSQDSRDIIFQTHFLSPQQGHSMVCLGVAAGVSVVPASKRST